MSTGKVPVEKGPLVRGWSAPPPRMLVDDELVLDAVGGVQEAAGKIDGDAGGRGSGWRRGCRERVSTPEELTVKPEMVPCEGQVEGVGGGVGVVGGEMVTTKELVFETYA